MAVQVRDEIYSAFQLSDVRRDLLTERAANCPLHPTQGLVVTWTRKITLDEGITVPVRAEVMCPRCGQPVDVNLLESDAPPPRFGWPQNQEPGQ